MYRTIWLYYFVSGALGLGAGLPAIGDWAAGLVPSAAAAACHMAEPLAGVSRADVALCLASWLHQGRDLLAHGIDVLAGAHVGLNAAGWLRVVDTAVILAGCVATALALLWLWASFMTRFAALSLSGTYSLMRAIAMLLAPRRA
jgi:hypothetical protein